MSVEKLVSQKAVLSAVPKADVRVDSKVVRTVDSRVARWDMNWVVLWEVDSE